MQKTIMVIGAGILQTPAIKIAKEMGLFTVVTDYNEHAHGMKLADYPIIMSTRDVDGTVRTARKFARTRPIHGVITVGTDASLTVAAVAQALNLPGNRVDVAEATTNKIKMRKRLGEKQVPQPGFCSCWSYQDVQEAAKKLGYPFVIKPADNMGARGVMKVDTPECIPFAFHRAKNASPRGEIIAEQYMEGPELSIDSLIYRGRIHITGVADRIIEFPPYFVETGHIMPTNQESNKIKDALEVFENGIRALGIETGAAKGDIKLTPDGAKVGEIASRLSGGYMSAYTYPYSSGVNLIKAAINIALGGPPGDLRPKYSRVACERAIIPGTGVVKSIQGVEDALDLPGVKNVFITCSPGDTVHIPTSNVEKCGNVIAVGETREQALEAANLGVKTIKINLGNHGGLNEGLIRKEALIKLEGICRVCSRCDGIECAGQVPGIGSQLNGKGFIRNIRALGEHTITPRILKGLDNINTGADLFGQPLDLPVLPAPMSNMRRNLKGILEETEYNKKLLKGAKSAGAIGCIAQKEFDPDGENVEYITSALSDVYGHGIPFFNPYFGESCTLKNIEKACMAGIKVCGLSLDVRDGLGAARMNRLRLEKLIESSPVPVIVKGILSREDALEALSSGARGVVLSNRGGRVLESLPPGIEVLPEIAESLKGRALLIVDGGIRTGEDVFKALSLGADLVMIGRPVLIHLVGGGSEGAWYYLNRVQEQLREVMLLAGVKTVKEVSCSSSDEDLQELEFGPPEYGIPALR
ncbi:MAG: alpha-hydroxy-acid oxidizing protein [Spirochaetota bacterium]